MEIIQSCEQGGRHTRRNIRCEDRTHSFSNKGVNVIALADGAGNEKYTHSAEGAECVTKAVCRLLCDYFERFYIEKDTEKIRIRIIEYCQAFLSRAASQAGLDSVMRLSSTMLAVAVKDTRAIIVHIGDGVIGKLGENGAQVVSAPSNGEFAGETYFVTNPHAENHLTVIKENAENTDAYFMMSDGVSDCVYDEMKSEFLPAAEKFACMSYEENGGAMLSQAIRKYITEEDSMSDDCSFICMPLRKYNPVSKKEAVVPLEKSDKAEEYKLQNVPERIKKVITGNRIKTIIAAAAVLLIIISVFAVKTQL